MKITELTIRMPVYNDVDFIEESIDVEYLLRIK